MPPTLKLPFAHLNLRWNPFGEPAWEERAGLSVVEVDDAVRFLSEAGRAVQVVGRSGRGKTTHLLALQARLPGPMVRFPEDGTLPPVPRADVLYLDEAQRMPSRLRRRVFRPEARLVIGSHADHSRELARAGFAVRTMRIGGLDPRRLRAIIARRIEWARRGRGPVPEVGLGACRRLIERFGDDIRAVEEYLYERVQALEEVGHVRV